MIEELLKQCNDKDCKVITFVDREDFKRIGYQNKNDQIIYDGATYEECLTKLLTDLK